MDTTSPQRNPLQSLYATSCKLRCRPRALPPELALALPQELELELELHLALALELELGQTLVLAPVPQRGVPAAVPQQGLRLRDAREPPVLMAGAGRGFSKVWIKVHIPGSICKIIAGRLDARLLPCRRLNTRSQVAG